MPNKRRVLLLASGTALILALSPQPLRAAPRHGEGAAGPAPPATPVEPSAPRAAGRPSAEDDGDDEPKAPVTEIVVTARRLDLARASVVPSLGASSYSVPNDVVESRPGGEAASLNHVLLQFPGVSQAGSGEVRVRNQAHLQYRINNVILPEGFSDPADTLRARFAGAVQLVRGALPAQYGLQTGGVIDITTKNGVYQHGGEIEAYGGSHGRREAAFEAAGSTGDTNFYISGSYLHDDAGLPALDSAAHPPHDRSDDADAFLFVDHIIDPQSRASLMAGVSTQWNELPTLGDPALTALAQAPGASSRIDLGGVQRQQSAYAIGVYQLTAGKLTYQASASLRYGTLRVGPDPAEASPLTDEAVESRGGGGAVQVDGVYEAASDHKLRAGLVLSFGRETDKARYVLPLEAAEPSELVSQAVEHRTETSLYAQDEWRPWEALTVNFGLRFDKVSGDGGGTQVGPRLNTVWDVRPGTTVHVGFARYITPAPQKGEASFARRSDLVQPARAETDNYFDLGLEQAVGDLKLGVDGYWRDARNLLDEGRVGSTALRRPFNFAEGRARGVEFNVTYADGPVSAWANVAFSRAEGRRIVSGEPGFTQAELAAAAAGFISTNDDQRVTASFGASYRWHALRLSADGLYGSGLPRTLPGASPNGGRLPSYLQANISVVYRLDGLRDRPLDLRLDVANVFDERYALQDGTSLAGGFAQWGPRRGAFVGLEQQF